MLNYLIKLSAAILLCFIVISSQVQADDRSALDFLNQMRRANNLPVFQVNDALSQAADNHSRYMAAIGKRGHTEEEGLPEFTGTTHIDRLTAAGYPTLVSAENLVNGKVGWHDSVKWLITGIYHRIAFLHFNMDEIGYAMRPSYKDGDSEPRNYFSYSMGNSVMRSLCEQTSSSYGYHACTDDSKMIETSQFEVGMNTVANRGGEFAIYPWAGQQEVWPYFENTELPDPLPGIHLTGQPISIHFNPAKLKGKVIHIIDFNLFDPDGREVRLLPVKDQHSDPLFSKYDFAWFPEQAMAWNATYEVRMRYSVDGQIFHKDWSFTTADVPYEPRKQGPRDGVVVITPDITTLALPKTKVYSLVLSPELSSGKIIDWDMSYSGKIRLEVEESRKLEERKKHEELKKYKAFIQAFNVINITVPPGKVILTLRLKGNQWHEIVINGE